MRILLPPSEGKATPARGRPLDLGSLVYAEALGAKRAELLDALERLGAGSREEAVAALGISAGQAAEVEIDAALRGAPAAPAAEVYTGVLYDRLALAELPAAARRRVLIFSALWGVVRLGDRIPYYRFSAKARLEGIGALAAWWRGALADTLPDAKGELLIDMRSAAYAAFWKPKRATLLGVRAFTESNGQRKPVSHMAKAVRGEVARALLEAARPPDDPVLAAEVVAAAGFEVELSAKTLDVIVADDG